MKISPIASYDWLQTQKISKKKSDEYVTSHVYDHEVTWNESVSDSFDITLSNNDIQINFANIINVLGCSCSTQTQQHELSFKFSLAFIHALILLLGSFLLLTRRSAVCEKKRLHSRFIPPKHENTSGVNDPCST